MVSEGTFLLLLYCLVDDFCKLHLASEARQGPTPSLSRSEVITLVMYAQWHRFSSEQEFYRYALRHFLPLFPKLPALSQYNRLVRYHTAAIEAFFLHLAQELGAAEASHENVDCTALPIRNAKRRGEGWLPGYADIGYSLRRFWYEGFHLLGAATPQGVVTGYGLGAASSNDRALAEAFFALRATPGQQCWPAAGEAASGEYLADTGFAGFSIREHWNQTYGAVVWAPPQQGVKRERWTSDLRRWVSRHRQIIESVFCKLFGAFRLEHERPHSFTGLRARLAATFALHNFCIWLNRQLGRPNLAFADLVGW